MNRQIALLIMILLLLWNGSSPATAGEITGKDQDVIHTVAFLNGHPDQKFRAQGQQALADGKADVALANFTRAALYADKLSQAAVAELLWNAGHDTQDRPLAYAWMDIAAERGTPFLVAKRELFWRQLNDQERKQALSRGQPLLDRYADVVAKPRLEKVLRQERRRSTGSRLGKPNGALSVCISGGLIASAKGPIVNCTASVEGGRFYEDKFWEPASYWAWQDTLLNDLQKLPRVNVGSPTQIDH